MTNAGRNILRTNIENWFTYHAPRPDQTKSYELLRDGGKELALMIVALCPPGPDRTVAVRKVREAVMTANQAIACEHEEG
jgi:hypothetical protein